MMKEIKSTDKKYRVQSAKAHSYKVTIPKILYDEINDVKTLGIKISSNDFNSTVDFYTEYDDKLVERDIVSSNRTVRVPAAIGDGLRLRREMINWKLLSADTGGYVLRLISSYIPIKLDIKSWDLITTKEIKPVGSDDKEHFELYLHKDAIEWNTDTELSFIIAENEDNICLRCQPTTEQNISKTTTTLIGDNKEFIRFYIPRSIVRSSNLVNKSVSIYKNKKSLAIIK